MGQVHSFGGAPAVFAGTRFKTLADFLDATFDSKVVFETTVFGGEANFRRAEFAADTVFALVTFTANAYFDQTIFKENATVLFLGDQEQRMFNLASLVRFDWARLYRPDRLSFNAVALRPSWVVNVSARGMSFTNVIWRGLPDGPEASLDEEISGVRERGYGEQESRRLLAKTLRDLAVNAEDDRRYE